nr:MAG TPA: DNA binding protein [Bacteriophage sp.]
MLKLLWFKCPPPMCYMLLSLVKISGFDGKLAL